MELQREKQGEGTKERVGDFNGGVEKMPDNMG